MTAFHIQTPSDGRLTLNKAVLVYTGAQDQALATLHDVEEVNGRLTLMPGQAMTVRAAKTLARALAKSQTQGGFLPETVLYCDGDLLIWWVQPSSRHIAFKTAEWGEQGAIMPHPGLVFAASPRRWQVWAVKGKQRPTSETPLFQAPYFNVWQGGGICQGSVQLPSGSTAEKIDAWNDAFFQSYFTHPNVRGKNQLLRYPGGVLKFWKAMLDGHFKRFPERILVPLNLTLSELPHLNDR